MAQLHTTYGATDLVAASALSSADHLQQRAATKVQWMTRGPATWRDAQTALAQANPQPRAPLPEGDRGHVLPPTYAGVQRRWVRIASERRWTPAQRTVGTPRLKSSNEAVQGVRKLGRTLCAGEAEARQALSTFVRG